MIRKNWPALICFNVAAILVVTGLSTLAAWQFQRRTWKLDLIARVDARVAAAPEAAPSSERWDTVNAANDEYRRVFITGRWLDARPALVQAVTELGGGYWVLSPMLRDDDSVVYVNRGFVPAENRGSLPGPGPERGPHIMSGLLRLSEPGGGFLRQNDPGADRWFSRDVQAIAQTRGLQRSAPYFIDADRTGNEPPIGGLTVVRFKNNHLIYACTWALLALMCVVAAAYVNIDLFRQRRSGRQ